MFFHVMWSKFENSKNGFFDFTLENSMNEIYFSLIGLHSN